MKLKNVLMLAVVGLVAYGGIKGYIYFKVKDQMDNLVVMASPFVDLSYGGVTSSLMGEVGVDDLRIAPRGAPMAIDIASITLRGDGPGFLYDLMGGVKMNEPPAQMDLALKGMRVPVSSDFLTKFNPGMATIAPEACSLAGIMQHAALNDVGYEQILADAHMGYRLNKKMGELTLRFNYDLDGIEHSEFDAVLQNVSSPGAVAMGAMPTLRRMSMSYSLEQDYISKVTAYCAREAGLESAAFIDDLFAQDKAYYVKNLGFVPGQGIKAALKELLSKSGELLITAAPGTPINPLTLAAYKPADMVAMLDLGLSVNQKPVGDLSFEVPNLKQLVSRLSGEDGGSSNAQGRQKKAPRPKLRYITTPVSELRQYIGKEVRLFTKGDKVEREPQRGTLIAMNGNMLDVEQRVHGGRMTVHIPLKGVDHVEVLRRP